jgi:hypothetical protein
MRVAQKVAPSGSFWRLFVQSPPPPCLPANHCIAGKQLYGIVGISDFGAETGEFYGFGPKVFNQYPIEGAGGLGAGDLRVPG